MNEANEATVDSILLSLKEIYWKGVKREVCEAILAFHKIEQFFSDLSAYETDNRNVDLSGENFKKFSEILTPYLPPECSFNSDEIYRKSLEYTKTHLSIDILQRRARYLLQAIGLLDIDVVHDSMSDETIGRHNHHPLGESLTLSDGTTIFREMRCRGCARPLRGYFFYECKEGCNSIVPELVEDPFIESCKSKNVKVEQFSDELQREILQQPGRLCPACIGNTKLFKDCNRAHYTKVNANHKVKGLAAFESRLRNREFEKNIKQRGSPEIGEVGESSYQPVLTRAMYKLVDPSHYAKAGPIHFALMFGPLMIENGVPDSMNGALISCRPVPSLQYHASMQLISTEEDAQAESQENSFVTYVYDDRKDPQKRLIKACYRPQKNRRFLGCAKKVFAGVFSGHERTSRVGEDKIIARFIEAKNAFPARMDMGITGAVRYHRAKLQTLVQPVIDAIEQNFAQEIGFYLLHFAKSLSNKQNTLKWSIKNNNCQDFYRVLLKGLPINLSFFPPKEYLDLVKTDQELIQKAPRYCLSFGADTDTPMALLRPQWRSLIWNFYHNKRDYCDMIEFGELFRTKLCKMPTEPWQVLDGIDDGEVHGMTLVDALWSIPRDSISIIQTHLLRHRSRYATKEGKELSEAQWYENRLRVFHQLDVFASLSGGLVKTLCEELAQQQHLLPKMIILIASTFGTFHAEERFKTPRFFGYEFSSLSFLSGREREWNRQGIEHEARKLWKKIS